MTRIAALVLVCSALMVAASFAHPLEGVWTWQHTVLETGEIIDPTTEGYTREVLFGGPPDQEFVEFRGYDLFRMGLWSLSDLWIGPVLHEYLRVDDGGSGAYLEGLLEIGPQERTLIIHNYKTHHFERGGVVPREQSSWGHVKSLYR